METVNNMIEVLEKATHIQRLFVENPELHRFLIEKNQSFSVTRGEYLFLDTCDNLHDMTLEGFEEYVKSTDWNIDHFLDIILDDYTNYYLLDYYHNGRWYDGTFYSHDFCD